jgi:hypothetical protein
MINKDRMVIAKTTHARKENGDYVDLNMSKDYDSLREILKNISRIGIKECTINKDFSEKLIKYVNELVGKSKNVVYGNLDAGDCQYFYLYGVTYKYKVK